MNLGQIGFDGGGHPPDGRSRPVGVLIVDDTRTARATIRAVLGADPRFAVLGEASDAYTAREQIKALAPDVLTLDVEMPGMNGLTFLRNLMRLRPMPVVMVSSRTQDGSATALEALSIGAVDCVDIRSVAVSAEARTRLADTIFAAAGARVRALGTSRLRTPGDEAPVPPGGRADAPFAWNGRIVLIGASTGGVDALERVLSRFPPDGPPTLVAQHMPRNFLASFAERLNASVAPEVRLAEHGAPALPGTVLIAPGGRFHLAVRSGAPSRARLVEDAGDQLYVPSVDLLFRSALDCAPRIVAVVLTGMGRDGAEALALLHARGAETVVQNAETAVVDGMPGAARATGAATWVVPLDQVAHTILQITSRTSEGPR